MANTDERLKHALKERAVPGLYWGIIFGGMLTALQIVFSFRITKANDVVIIALGIALLILTGIFFGALGTYWWKEVRNQSYLPAEETGKARQVVPLGFAVLGLVIILLLNISMQQYYLNQKEYLLGALSFLIIISDFMLIGTGLGSGGYLGIMWWKARKIATPTTKAATARKVSLISPRLYERIYGWRWNILITAIATVLLVGAVLVFFFWGGSGNPQPTAKTATVTATVTVTATEVLVILPSPTIPAPTPTSMPPTPTIPPVPQPPAGVPVVQPTTVPVTAPTRTATVQRPTATRTAPAPVVVCSYTTVAGDTWSSVAAKTSTNLGALMQKNPGINPAQPGMGLKLPKTGCP